MDLSILVQSLVVPTGRMVFLSIKICGLKNWDLHLVNELATITDSEVFKEFA